MLSRWSCLAVLIAAIGMGAVVGGAAPADAIGPTSFSMSPSSGPPGTAVTVSGRGCAPGLLLSKADRVVVALATRPPASVQIPVSSSGAWSGTVTVPSNAKVGRAFVTGLCFTDGLPSLLTLYGPLTFTVTAAAATSTTRPAPTTVPGSSQPPPATSPPSGGSTTPTRPFASPTTQPPGGSGGPVAGGPGSTSTTPGTTHASGGTRRAAAVAADLHSPDLAGGEVTIGGHGLGWIGWLALALLVAGLAAGALLFRHYGADDESAEA